jgi:hypothetical protein
LGVDDVVDGRALDLPIVAARVFDEREPNRVWAQKMWRWACATGATHLAQFQDDVFTCVRPWSKITAMVEAVPDQIIGLEQAHPMGPELAHKGHRWCRTRAWLIGPAYLFPLDPALPNGLPTFLKWCDANPERVAAENEDTLVNRWAVEAGVDIWHPIPTCADHDTSVPSTYGNEAHSHRRPTVTWRGYPDGDLESAEYWRPPVEPNPVRLVDPYTNLCWYCVREAGAVAAAETGARIGKACLQQIFAAMVTRL